MNFGICTDLKNAQLIKSIGFDYIEGSLSGISQMSKDDIREKLELFNDIGIKMDVTNMFFPGEIKLAGNDADMSKINDYIHRAFDNASAFGVETCVLGSGNARRIPNEFDYNKGYEQVLESVRLSGEIAQEYGITVVIEPLNTQETNVFTTVKESLEACKKINLENVCVLADLYHVFVEKEDFSILPVAGEKLRHIHFCNPTKRIYPASDDGYDYAPFVTALKQAGYNGKISIEARSDDLAKDSVKALELLKQIFSTK